jgi:ABC-type glycerol-3-phosphate transport system substrate-binding protein
VRRLRAPALAVAVATLAAACSGSGASEAAAGAPRTARAGAVEVTATPLETGDGARFRLVFETHTVELDFDPLEVVALETAGGTVAAAGWDGPGPGGHHRDGVLSFATDEPLEDLVLRVRLDETVTLDWKEGP